jgi:hypothetical protein
LGWRTLPTARPGRPEWAIRVPSVSVGAKTWSKAMAPLQKPAQSHATKKSSPARGVAPAPPDTATAKLAQTNAMKESASDDGNGP